MRDKTYWPKLCLVQIAGPEEAAAIDTLAPGIDLKPLSPDGRSQGAQGVPCRAAGHGNLLPYDREDPTPLVDTQVAAMVCGFGDAVSYETLAAKLAKARIDKSSRFTDWSHRPLTDRQLQYALSDVTHLRPAYEKLARRLAKNGRIDWVAEEMAVLTAPATYRLEPREAWRRHKAPQRQAARPGHAARGRRLARGGGAAARPAAQPHRARRDAERDRRPCAERRRGSGALPRALAAIAESRQGARSWPRSSAGWRCRRANAPSPAAPRPAAASAPGRTAARAAQDALRGPRRGPEARRQRRRSRADRRRRDAEVPALLAGGARSSAPTRWR